MYINSIIPNGGCKDVMIHCEIVSTVIVPTQKGYNAGTTRSFLENSFQADAAKGHLVCAGLCWICLMKLKETLPSDFLPHTSSDVIRGKTPN